MQPSVQDLTSLFRGNPGALQQRIQSDQQGKPGIPQDLQKLLALNIVTNEKDGFAKQQAMDQLAQMGGQQGKPPTVMQSVQEQARQKAQAQAVQQQQQQQGIQALMQNAGRDQVATNAPQPEVQPQGIDELPVNFEMAGGGIVAFQNRGAVPRIQDETPISEEERAQLERELLMRIIGEEARNPPERKQPMEITESDLSSVPGMESGDLMAKELRKIAGPQPDNRAMLNRIDARDARHTAMLEREQAKSAARPKYETPYDRMNRENRGELTEEERKKQATVDSLISQIPKDKNLVEGGERADSTEVGRNVSNILSSLPGAGASKATTLGRQALAGIASLFGSDKSNAPEAAPAKPAVAAAPVYSNEGITGVRPYTPATPAPTGGLRDLVERPVEKKPVKLAAQQVASSAPVATTAPGLPAAAPKPTQEEDFLNKVFAMDPEIARKEKIARMKAEIPALDFTQRDAAIRALEGERKRLGEPAAGWDTLMEYLGQVSSTPRGMSSFEAGAAGARGQKDLQNKRSEQRMAVGMKIIEQEQGKIDATREYAKDVFGVGEKEFDRIFDNKLKTADKITDNKLARDRLAQELTLKEMDLKMRKAEEAGRAARHTVPLDHQAFAAELKRTGDPLKAYEAVKMAGAGSERQELAELKSLLTSEEKTAADPLRPAAVRAQAEKRAVEIKDQIASMTKIGAKPADKNVTPLPANASASTLTVGTVYQTAKGPAKWTGTGFAPI